MGVRQILSDTHLKRVAAPISLIPVDVLHTRDHYIPLVGGDCFLQQTNGGLNRHDAGPFPINVPHCHGLMLALTPTVNKRRTTHHVGYFRKRLCDRVTRRAVRLRRSKMSYFSVGERAFKGVLKFVRSTEP